jgi:hypothetical protein
VFVPKKLHRKSPVQLFLRLAFISDLGDRMSFLKRLFGNANPPSQVQGRQLHPREDTRDRHALCEGERLYENH